MKFKRIGRCAFFMLETHLVVRMGRDKRDELVHCVLRERSLVNELMQLVFSGSQTQRMKGAWVLSGLCCADASVVQPYYHQILNHLRQEMVGGVKRELLRCFIKPQPLTDQDTQLLLALTMDWVVDHQQDMAVRYVCFKILKKQLLNLPELSQELDYSIALFREKFGRFP